MTNSEYDLPPAQDYRGPAGSMSKGPWLKGDDLPDGKVIPVTIEKVNYRAAVKFTADGEPEEVWSLQLVGKKKEVKINSTIRKSLTTMFGSETGNWWGKRIGLSTIEQQVGKEIYKVIRIRELPSAQPTPPPVQPPQNPDADMVSTMDDNIPF